MTIDQSDSPAALVTRLMGGVNAVAAIIGRHRSRVARWPLPRDRGGNDGLVPAQYAALLLAHSRRCGGPLRPEHFFPAHLVDSVRAATGVAVGAGECQGAAQSPQVGDGVEGAVLGDAEAAVGGGTAGLAGPAGRACPGGCAGLHGGGSCGCDRPVVAEGEG